MEWTNEEVTASAAPTVTIVNENSEAVSTFSGKDAQRIQDEYFHALDVSRKLL